MMRLYENLSYIGCIKNEFEIDITVVNNGNMMSAILISKLYRFVIYDVVEVLLERI